MKRLFLLLLCSPWLAFSQETNYLVFESNTLTAIPSQTMRFEAAVAAHNKKYHASGPHGVRVYEIINGKNAGKYQWVMGPGHWSDLDTRPDEDDNHSVDWVANVLPNLTSEQNTLYIRFDARYSRFPKDFNVSKINFWYWDIIPNADWEKIRGYLDKIRNVYATKLPDDTYGVYYNELPSSSEGKDVMMGFFFDKYAWMGIDNGFDKKYEEVYGAGSWKTFLTEWNAQVKGLESEIWEYREDLSGLPPLVKASERQ